MSLRNAVILFVCLVATVAMGAVSAPDAQQTAATTSTADAATTVPEGGTPHYIRPETPQERQERLGTQDDPGVNPDPKQIFIRFGQPYTIQKYEKRYSKPVRPGWVRPLAAMNFVKEIYQENEKYVWIWNPETDRGIEKREKLAAAANQAANPDAAAEYFQWLRGEFTPLTPPAANVEIRFEEASSGLPTSGSWRNGVAVGDMNEDGFEDIIAPPQRGEANNPTIFLGDGKGTWKRWTTAKWETRGGFNYGTAVVADFNKDKHLDAAFAVHLTGVAVFLGDGKGNFRRADNSIPRDFATRRIVATDVDADGWTDVVAISEGPVPQKAGKGLQANLRAYLNRNKGQSWEAFDIAQPRQSIGGDWLSFGDFNGDKYPDFVGASIYFNGTQTVHMSGAEPKTYRAYIDTGGKILPARSYYHGNTTGHFASKKLDDAIISFSRVWPGPDRLNPKVVPPPPLSRVIGFDRLSFEGGQVKRTPIVRWAGSKSLAGVDRGDFDGDGNLDFAYTKYDPRELVVLLGDGEGKFRQATVSGVNLSGLRNYEIKVADVNNDKKPDVIVMYEAQETTGFAQKNGRIQVFLNRGAAVVK